MTNSTSSRSYQPSEIYSPSESPQPLKSKQNKVILLGNKSSTAGRASIREELFP